MISALRSAYCRSRPYLFSRKCWLRTAGVTLSVLATLWFLGWNNPVVTVEMRSSAGGDGQVYYARAGQSYRSDQHVAFPINANGKWHTYHIDIPERRGLERVRIDPGSTSGVVEIRRVTVDVLGHSTELVGIQLFDAIETTNDVRGEPSSKANLRFVAQAPDPYVGFTLPVGAGTASLGDQVQIWLTDAIVVALIWLLLAELVWLLLVRYLHLPRAFHKLAAWASDPGVLIVSPKAMALIVALLCSAALYVVLNLSQSSIGIWEEIYPARPISQLIDIGTPKHIRSDEWNTQTPWVLNQVMRGEKDHNTSIGGNEAPLLASVPILHSWTIAQGEFYGFHVFDLATGFSWWWAYRTFGLILSFFWLFLLLTRANLTASVLGTAWIYGSSFTQWWFSSNMPELLIAFALATIGGVYLLLARRRIMMAVGAALLAYSVLSLMLHLYPPFIVPLAYLGCAILVGLMLEPGRMAQFREQLRWRVLGVVATVLTTGLIGVNYLMDAMPSIKAMAGTSYPGHRIALGGDFPLVRLFYGFFEAFRVGEQQIPLPPSNASEASSFILLMPLLLLAIPLKTYIKKRNALLAILLLYCLVAGMWISMPLPRVLESAMQIVGWSWSPPARSILGLGIGSIIVTTILFSRICDDALELRSVIVRRMIPIVSMLWLLAFGWYLHRVDPAFFTPEVVFIGSAAVATITAGVVLGRSGLFAAGLLVAICPALTVNPLVSGLAAVEDKPILVAAKRQGNAPNDRWVVVGDLIFSQGLKAQGLDVITGSTLIPDLHVDQVLDPDGKYKDIWNRYAHVVIHSDPGEAHPAYELQGSDLYVITLNICSPALLQLGVTRIAYTTPVPTADLQCLTPLDAPADSGVRLFRLGASS